MINVKGLSFAYQGKSKIPFAKSMEKVFTRLELSVNKGQICGLLGPNGAGKTTLLKLMSGLIFPHSGNLEVLGFEPGKRDTDFLADIFYMPEEFYMPDISASAYGKRHGSFYPKFNFDQYFELINEFDLSPEKKLGSLSHGQKKKIMLAFGLATNARLVLLDEPSNGMDIPGRTKFRNVLLQTFDEERTFLISTHQVQDLEGLIDSVSILAEGEILLHDSLDSISEKLTFTNESNEYEAETALFSEKSIRGTSVIRENISGIETQVNLSALYGLVTSQKEEVSKILNSGVKS